MIACALDGLAASGFSILDVAFVIVIVLAAVFLAVRRHYTGLVVLLVVALVGGALILSH